MKLLIITGYSGAGKSVAMKACEDMGVVCMDNIPISVIGTVVDVMAQAQVPQLAICSDVRSLPFDAASLLTQIEQLRQRYECSVIFLQCRPEIVAARYNATKHRHPLYHEGACSLEENIRAEHQMLSALLPVADNVIDTSDCTPHLLKRQLQHMIGLAGEMMSVDVMSFSYSKGVPANADMVLDVRFLQNPHYVPALQPLTGRDMAVAEFISKDAQAAWFMAETKQMVTRLIPLYLAEGKSYFTLAFGCTGGKHRSVFLAETLYHYLQENGYHPTLHHRELGINA